MRDAIQPTREPADRSRVEDATRIMARFADRTGVGTARPSPRYLWTDAFAVCNFIGLAQATGDRRHYTRALDLVDAVHRVLGRHREDDERIGWLSGLSDREAARHPTAKGLRIGKKLPERTPDEPYRADLEWDRDGQYFHYLTKWMHALDQLSRFAHEPRFNAWARELAKVAHAGFVTRGDSGARMAWKMSIDLSRPLVPTMGQHDPLDGLVTTLELRSNAGRLTGAPPEPSLAKESISFAAMIEAHALATTDPLGLGSLLVDAARLAQLRTPGGLAHDALLQALLAAARYGLRVYDVRAELEDRPERRLAYRELGLAIGLSAIPVLVERLDRDGDRELAPVLTPFLRFAPLADAITSFWLQPEHQREPSYTEHLDINEVMLATALLPSGYLRITPR